MSGKENLIPFNKLPADRHRELSQKGGRASGTARRARRERIEAAKIAQTADHELYRDSVELLRESAKLLKKSSRRL